MKKLSLVIAVVMVLSACVGLCIGCQTTASASSYVAVDINPSVELVLDGKNNVMSVRAANSDAEILLYGAEGIVGVSVEQASAKIAELALTYNFVTEENSNIGVTVTASDGKTEEQIFASIDASFQQSFEGSGLNISLSNVGGIMLQKELERVKGNHADNTAVQSLTVSKYRLVKSAMAADRRLTVDVAAAMSVEELTEIVREAHEYFKDNLGDAYEYAYEKAKIFYEKTKAALLDAAYVTVAPLQGAKYTAMRSAYFALEEIEELRQDIDSIALSEADVRTIGTLLGLSGEELTSFMQYVADGDGTVTEDSIEYYIDRLCRNMTEEEKEAFESKLDAVEDKLEELEEKMEVIASDVLESIANAMRLAGITIEGEIETYDDLEDKVMEVLEDEIEALEEWFDKNLSDSQKQQVKQLQDNCAAQIARLETEFNTAVETAKEQAKEALKQAQQARVTITVG